MIHASERDTERVQVKRADYQLEITAAIVGHLKFLDEAGSNIAMTRLYGRAAPGERVVDTAPQNYGENTRDVGNALARRDCRADDRRRSS